MSERPRFLTPTLIGLTFGATALLSLGRSVLAESDDGGGSSSASPASQVIQSVTRLEPTVKTDVTTTTQTDSDGDGLWDNVDPHPTIPEIYIVKDDNHNGIVDRFESGMLPADRPTVTYSPGEVVVDTDLDGLTDEGERQVFGTDQLNPDSDGDGLLDGVEIMRGSNPLDPTSPFSEAVRGTLPGDGSVPWAWYATRGTGLVAFFLTYVVIFTGLAVRLPGVRSLIRPASSLSLHRWLSLQALAFALGHAVSLLFDRLYHFTAADVFIPFHAVQQPVWFAVGTLVFYGMIILVATSLWKRFLPFRLWRAVHFLNIAVYAGVVAHALFLGTDLQAPLYRIIFIGMNAVLAFLMLVTLLIKLWGVLQRRLIARAAL